MRLDQSPDDLNLERDELHRSHLLTQDIMKVKDHRDLTPGGLKPENMKLGFMLPDKLLTNTKILSLTCQD